MIFILLHYLLSFVTVTSYAHQHSLCCVISSFAAIFVPYNVRVRRSTVCVYGSTTVPRVVVGGRHLVTVPQGVGGNVFPGWGRTRGGGGPIHCGIHGSHNAKLIKSILR